MLVLVVVLAAGLSGPAEAAPGGSVAPAKTLERELALRYSPVVMIGHFDPPCGPGEAYEPVSVDAVLGNPEVAWRQVGNGDPVIMWGPHARDLYDGGPGTYLDLPGAALSPGCIYARDSARYAGRHGPAIYAHVATQADRPGYIAVQYWFYWYYNDWNDKHESDWEFVQVLFRADSVEQALRQGPTAVGYAQHEGGEVAEWGADKLQRKGSHPVVYPSQGSHASYFTPALYLGRGASEGFGCDNTQAPSTRLDPRVILLPDTPLGPGSRFAWLTYQGRWGERHSGPNNGPDGPAGKSKWSRPVTWQEDLRPASFVIPGGSDAPPAVVGTFCSVVGKGSVLFIRYSADPAAVLVSLGVLLLALLLLVRRTSWDVVDVSPVAARRRLGEIVRASFRLFRRHLSTFLPLGLLAVPVGILDVLLTVSLPHLPFLGGALTVATDRGDAGGRTLVASWVAASLWPVTVVLVSAAVAHVMAQGSSGTSGTGFGWERVAAAVGAVFGRLRGLASAYAGAAVAIALLSLVGLGAPIALWLAVRYQFIGQTVMIDGLAGKPARRRSSDLVQGRWWHTATVALLIWVGIHVVGVLLGLIALIVFTSLPLWSISLVVLVSQVALTPLGAIALTLLYGDAVAELEQSGAERLAESAAPIG